MDSRLGALPDDIGTLFVRAQIVPKVGPVLDGYVITAGGVYAVGVFMWGSEFTFNKNLPDPEWRAVAEELAEAYVGAKQEEAALVFLADPRLNALAIGPGLPLPSRWMPVIWGGKGDPVAESAEQAHRIVSLIMRRMNMIGAMLGREPPAFEPILYEGEVEGGGTIVVAHDWCAGFLAGVELAFDDWQPLLGDQSDSAFLVPLVKLGTDEGRDEINGAEEPRAKYDKFRPGRNDSCSCGSGRPSHV